MPRAVREAVLQPPGRVGPLRMACVGAPNERDFGGAYLVDASAFRGSNCGGLREALDSGPWSSL